MTRPPVRQQGGFFFGRCHLRQFLGHQARHDGGSQLPGNVRRTAAAAGLVRQGCA